MALSTQIIPCGAQNLGGGYTEVGSGWSYYGAVAGRTYRVKLRGTVSSTTSNFGIYDNVGADAWYNPPERNFTIQTGAYRLGVIGRNNGGNLTFTDYEIQDTGSDEGVATVQVAAGLATGAVTIASATAGNLLVATIFVHEQGGSSGATFPAITVPSGYTAAASQHGYDAGGALGVQMRTVYKVAAGGETSFTATQTGASYGAPDSVIVREYSGVGSTVLGVDTDGNTGDDVFSGTAPGGTPKLACVALGWGSSGTPRFDTGAGAGPFVSDYWATTDEAVQGMVGRDVDPTSYSVTIRPGGGGNAWASEVVYFSAAGGGGGGARSQAVVIG